MNAKFHNPLPSPLHVLRDYELHGLVTKKQLSTWTGACESTVRNWLSERTDGPSDEQYNRIGAMLPMAYRLELARSRVRGQGLDIRPAEIPECDLPPLEAGLEADERHAGWLRRLKRFFSDKWLSKCEAADLLAGLGWFRVYIDRQEAKVIKQLARQGSASW